MDHRDLSTTGNNPVEKSEAHKRHTKPLRDVSNQHPHRMSIHTLPTSVQKKQVFSWQGFKEYLEARGGAYKELLTSVGDLSFETGSSGVSLNFLNQKDLEAFEKKHAELCQKAVREYSKSPQFLIKGRVSRMDTPQDIKAYFCKKNKVFKKLMDEQELDIRNF